ncbi:hypothetical protein [Reichenbachiella sp.]|uniref:hypothetical protein n=1 Tax=Reichenbachiella sp. TaxID=2184521 RepID=UPI003BB0D280
MNFSVPQKVIIFRGTPLDTNLMPRVSTLTAQDQTIVFTDLTQVSAEEAPAIMDEAANVISQHPPKSVMSLVDMTDMRFNKVVIAKVTEIARINEPYVKLTAIVGLNSVAKLIAKSVIKLTGRNTGLFDNRDDAKEWLLSDQD